MQKLRPRHMLAAGALALISVSALAQTTPGPRDPYTQGSAAPISGTYDPNTSGARAGDKFDPYSQGADRATRQDLAPQPQAQTYQRQSYQNTVAPPARPDRMAGAYRGDMRWNGPLLGNRLGPRSLYLDGA
ncbi:MULTISPECIES: endonuclease [Cupriavidus]|uniref:Endonuclease n=2 Tax=Pseudomonadota TaxID=1224 RepID=A0A3G8H5H7_9BURK|nr:endonuclease [Cupriavidus pauculus]AZG15781.1 endonuclease [Cupriavidus pauculus]